MLRFRFGSAGVAGLLVLAAFQGCDSETQPQDSNSNWLSPCETQSDCQWGTCLCGFCTTSCDAPGDCSVAGAECIAKDDPRASARCTISDAPKVCLLSCSSEAQCESVEPALSCDDGLCVRAPASGLPDASAGGAAGSSSVPDGGPSSIRDSSLEPDTAPWNDDGGEPHDLDAQVTDAPFTVFDGNGIPETGATDGTVANPFWDAPPWSPPVEGPGVGEACIPANTYGFYSDSGIYMVPALDWCSEPYVCVADVCTEARDCSSAPTGEECSFATADHEIGDVEANDTHVYWVDRGTLDAAKNYRSDGAILRKAVPDGPVEIVEGGLRRPGEMMVTATHVYWITATNPSSALSDGTMWRRPLAGDAGAPELLFQGISKDMAETQWLTDDNHVYWISGAMRRVATDGSGVDDPFASGAYAVSLTQDTTNIYWLNSSGVYRAPKGGGAVTKLSSLSAWNGHIANAETVLLVTTGNRWLRAVDKATGLATNIAEVPSNIYSPTVQGSYAYVRGDALIMRIQFDPPGVFEHLVLTSSLDDFAVSPLGVFWRQSGQVRALLAP